MSREITPYLPEQIGPHWHSLWKGRRVSGFSVPHNFHLLSSFSASFLPWVFHGLIWVLDYFVLGSNDDGEVFMTQEDMGDLFQIKTFLRVWGENKMTCLFLSAFAPPTNQGVILSWKWGITPYLSDCILFHISIFEIHQVIVVLFRWLSSLHLQLRTLKVFFLNMTRVNFSFSDHLSF